MGGSHLLLQSTLQSTLHKVSIGQNLSCWSVRPRKYTGLSFKVLWLKKARQFQYKTFHTPDWYSLQWWMVVQLGILLVNWTGLRKSANVEYTGVTACQKEFDRFKVLKNLLRIRSKNKEINDRLYQVAAAVHIHCLEYYSSKSSFYYPFIA